MLGNILIEYINDFSILNVILGIAAICAQVTNPPVDSTASVGGNVTLTCGVSSVGSGVEWRRYTDTSGERICFVSSTASAACGTCLGCFPCTGCYMDPITYSLTMSDLQLAHGMDYGCEWLESGDARSASVVVAGACCTLLIKLVVVSKKLTA